jgi:DNA-binding response OmpR family regulator
VKTARVLLVDDDPLFTRLVAEYLGLGGGYEVRVENDSLRAVPSALQFGPDVVLLDVVMPGKSGMQVALEFQDCPSLREIPIIFVSGQFPPALEAVKDDVYYLSKPFPLSALDTVIEVVLRGAGEEVSTYEGFHAGARGPFFLPAPPPAASHSSAARRLWNLHGKSLF